MLKTKILRKYMYSPLRYPGGKSSLFGYFSSVFKENGWDGLIYIEPYAGGAGAALSLLISGKVKAIIINDYDVAIYSFWRAITDRTHDFIKKIENTSITPDEWLKQKQIYKDKNLDNILDLGFATLFLNRTNRSGILNAGPIGGIAQNGNWKMDARFNKEKIIEKIKLIASFKDKITILNQDGLQVIKKYSKRKRVFFYIDPPYYKKGALLYLNSFDHQKHLELAKMLNENPLTKWILSYDDVQEIRDMYIPHSRRFSTYSLRYSVHNNTKYGSELMIFSDSVLMNNSEGNIIS